MFATTLGRPSLLGTGYQDCLFQCKIFLGNLQLEQILFYFHNRFQLLFELEKTSSFVTRSISAKSFTRETASLHSCTRLMCRV